MHQPLSTTGATPAIVLWLTVFSTGLAWGLTGPLAKIAISTGHHPIGVTFWNTVIAVTVLSLILLLRKTRLPVSRIHCRFYLICGLLGTALPNSLSYWAYNYLPVGVIVLIIALVPMKTLLLALPLRLEQPDLRRMTGLALGIVGVLLIVLPDASLPAPELAIWVLLPIITSLSYAGENVYIAAARPKEGDSVTLLCGLNWGALFLLIPMTLVSDAWYDISRLGAAEQAAIAISFLHIGAYCGFIWLIGSAGPIFASQVGYIVTGSGVLFGMLMFDERHSPWIWAALVVMFAGLTLVQPKRPA